jgi:hypothetical protein
MIFVLGPISLGVLALALTSRGAAPLVPVLPAWSAAPRSEGAVLWEREDLFPGWPARLSVRADRSAELKALRPLVAPDVLVYWTPDAAVDLGSLPADAHLVARLGGTAVHRFTLPAHDVPAPAGALVLYSLGHQEVVAAAVLPSFAAEAGQ